MVSTSPRRITHGTQWPLFDLQATRRIERAALADVGAHVLMQRAGLAVARLALALAPHAQVVWVAAGPGNNGGDGWEAAQHLHRWGKGVVVTWLGSPETASADATLSRQRALDLGVAVTAEPPDHWDLCVDALLGIGATRAPEGRMAQWIIRMRSRSAPVLSIDIPTGLNADTGQASQACVHALATLCLLTLKPGLFTADGRDASAQVWLDDLQGGVQAPSIAPGVVPSAMLSGAPRPRALAHASHKGSYGDVVIVGGARGMAGAALLAGSAALHAGAGRVYVSLLDEAALPVNFAQPELMLRPADPLDLTRSTVVCGCGGADAVRAYLPRVLSSAARLVLDADALNALASDVQLQGQLRARAARKRHTVLTPHPLEAARLLGITGAEVQKDRLAAAQRMVHLFQCTVVLKGSGSIVAAPNQIPSINPTGNARLATAGTGDVLAGAIGAALATGLPEFQAACEAVYLHGQCADEWPADRPLSASLLASALRPHAAATRPS